MRTGMWPRISRRNTPLHPSPNGTLCGGKEASCVAVLRMPSSSECRRRRRALQARSRQNIQANQQNDLALGSLPRSGNLHQPGYINCTTCKMGFIDMGQFAAHFRGTYGKRNNGGNAHAESLKRQGRLWTPDMSVINVNADPTSQPT